MWEAVNAGVFKNAAFLRLDKRVGRSLVANRTIQLGEVVLVDEAVVSYDLYPTCMSSRNPFWTKRLWSQLETITEEEFLRLGLDLDGFSCSIPAALMALMQPKVQAIIPSLESFFFCPREECEKKPWTDTINAFHNIARRANCEVTELMSLNPSKISNFLGIIYGNAHGLGEPVALDRPTHTKRRVRRKHYEAKHPNDGAFSWVEWPSERHLIPPRATIGLFPWGSRFSHSCCPNLFAFYSPVHRQLYFVATRPIAVGELLSFSYLNEDKGAQFCSGGDLLCGSVLRRRRHLEKFKFFTCACLRCVEETRDGKLAESVSSAWEDYYRIAGATARPSSLERIRTCVTSLEKFKASTDVLLRLAATESILRLLHLSMSSGFVKSPQQQKHLKEVTSEYVNLLWSQVWVGGHRIPVLLRVSELRLRGSESGCEGMTPDKMLYVKHLTKHIPELRTVLMD